MKRHLYGFRFLARLRQIVEERKGRATIIRHELVNLDGKTLTILRRKTSPLSLAPYYQTWPLAKVAWVVYVDVMWRKGIDE